MIRLHELPALVKKRKRVGRGGSRGGTSGKGHKGQKARSGGRVARGFEGGQMPLYRRLPKRGFNNTVFSQEMCVINVGQLNNVFEAGSTIDLDALIARNLISKKKSQGELFVKVLGDGELTKKLVISAHAFSKSAIKAIEDQGGEARLLKGM